MHRCREVMSLARKRPHQRSKAHDRRHMYRSAELPQHARIAAVDIEDPYAAPARLVEGNLDYSAELEPVRHRDGTMAEGAPAWTPPTRPLIRVIQALRNDPLGHMRARGQIDGCQFLAGREYQRLTTAARIGRIKSGGMPISSVDGSRQGDGISEQQRTAVRRLAKLDHLVGHRLGSDAVLLMLDVLGECLPIEIAARRREVIENDRHLRWWGQMFRKVLDVLAIGLGLANGIRKRLPFVKRTRKVIHERTEP